jgi:hypothetical protein
VPHVTISRHIKLLALLAASVVLAAPGVQAAALDADSCAKLKTQQEQMEKAGLKDIVARGPEWAKANLPPEKINDIKRWIEVDEQLLFRCPGRHLVNLPLEPDPPPPPPPAADDKKPDSDKAAAPAATPPAPAAVPPPAEKKAATPEKKAATPDKKTPEKKAAPQRKAPAAKDKSTPETGDDGEPKAAPKVKATAKQKPKDDAYRPPAGDSNNPFGLN